MSVRWERCTAVGIAAALFCWEVGASLPLGGWGDNPLQHPTEAMVTTLTGPSSGSPVAFTALDTVTDQPRTGPLLWAQETAQDTGPRWAFVAKGYDAAQPPHLSLHAIVAQQLIAALSPDQGSGPSPPYWHILA
jgi:hypothetical protein